MFWLVMNVIWGLGVYGSILIGNEKYYNIFWLVMKFIRRLGLYEWVWEKGIDGFVYIDYNGV